MFALSGLMASGVEGPGYVGLHLNNRRPTLVDGEFALLTHPRRNLETVFARAAGVGRTEAVMTTGQLESVHNNLFDRLEVVSATNRNGRPAVEDLSHATIGELSARLAAGEISPVEVVRASLQQIEKLNSRLNAFITVLADEAVAQAKTAEAEIAKGRWRGPLHGIPVGIKDLFDTAGVRTTAAFESFRNRVPKEDAVAVRKLERAGAIVVGKTNMHRLAMGTTSTISDFGPVRNPWNANFVAGGSSGGSAAAVATGMCFATLDTDAIGSCRLPASCCGVTGFKGSYGLISNKGVLDGEPVDDAILWLAHAAVTTRGAADTALVLNVLAEPDLASETTIDYAAALENDTIPRIGIVKSAASDEDVEAAFLESIVLLRKIAVVREVTASLDCPGLDVRNIVADRGSIAARLLADVDVLVLPTTPTTVPSLDIARSDPMAVSAQNTLFANYYGLPAISVPCGIDRNGLPVGVQIVGRPRDDITVLRVAHRFQNARGRCSVPGSAQSDG